MEQTGSSNIGAPEKENGSIPTEIAIETAIERFLEYLRVQKGYSAHTVEAYAGDLAQWSDFLEGAQLEWRAINHKNLIRFLSEMSQEREISRSSQARKSAALKSFYRYAEIAGWVDSNPLQKFHSPKYKKPLPRPLRPIEMEKMLEDDSGQNRWIQIRDKALMETIYSSGMRISEALSLRLPDIADFEGSIYEAITITGKGAKERVVFIGAKAREALESYLSVRGEALKRSRSIQMGDEKGQALFLNYRGGPLTRRGASHLLKMRKHSLSAEENVSPHSFRHSFATDLLNSGADIRMVQEMLGHSSVSTTQNYTHVAREKIQWTFRNCHPHAKK